MKLVKPIAFLIAGLIFLFYWLSRKWSFEMDLIFVMAIEICFLSGFSYLMKCFENRSVK
jgi:hypothetical protein